MKCQGNYLVPCPYIVPAEKKQPIGLFSHRYLRCLKEHHRIAYTNLLTSSKLNAFLPNIDKQAQERFKTPTEQMKQSQGITGAIKG